MNVWPGGIINKFGGLVYEKLKEKEKAGGENTSAKRFSSTLRLRGGKHAGQPTGNHRQTSCGALNLKNRRAICRPLQPIVLLIICF